ncbi:hypothetical protein GJV77_01130 [Myroides pelagicus]|uniref:ComEC/Rec2-related protein domain-containing protein n=1 Tax=Myroides pelagicus TaxID=270914 RepID=A0A7K1GHU0_9FLAO|nr:hypothetical protein [Myroides pelagicus]
MYVTFQITEQVYMSDVLELGESNLWRDRLRRFREFLINNVSHEEQLTTTAKSFVLALVFGDRSMLDADIKSKFSTLGIMHILAISGLHIGIIYLLLLGVVSYFNRKVRFVLITIALWFFVFLSGFSPPVYRAVLMFSFISLSFVLNRDTNLANSVGIALVVSLLLEPLLIYNVSFQLSYLAVLSIVFFYPLVGRIKGKYKLVNYFIDILLISTVVQVGLIPLQLYYFEQFSFGFLIGNLIAIPAVTILLILSIFNVFILVIFGRISFVFTEVLNITTAGFTWVIDQLQWFSFLVFEGVKINQYQIGIYFMSIICLYFIYRTRKKLWLIPLLCSFNLFAILSNSKLYDDVHKEYLVFPYVYKKDTVKFFYYQNDALKHVYFLEAEKVVRILPFQQYTFLF